MYRKQSFSFKWKDERIFGCSFRKGTNGQYFGWVTVYKNKDEYNGTKRLTGYTDYKNIPLETTPLKSEIALHKFCETL